MKTIPVSYLLSCAAAGLLSFGALQLLGQPAPAPAAQKSPTEQGVALYKTRRYAEAKEILMKAAASNPKDVVALAYLGQVHSDYDHDPDSAVASLEEAVKLDRSAPSIASG